MLTDKGETSSFNIHGDPSYCPKSVGSSKDGLMKRLDGDDSSTAVVVVGASEEVKIAVEEGSASEVIAVDMVAVDSEIRDSEVADSEVADSEVADSEVIKANVVTEDSATEIVAVVVGISLEVRMVAVEGFGLHGLAYPLPQNTRATNVRQIRVAFIVVTIIR
jgi:hypothetical protein